MDMEGIEEEAHQVEVEEDKSNDEDESDSQSPKPKSRTSIPRAEKRETLKRQAEYDSNAISDSEGGQAGLLLADMASPAKKPRTSALPDKIRKLEAEAAKPGPKPPTKKAVATPKNDRGKKTSVAPLPAIDYEAMVAPYVKKVVQMLMLKQFESIKKCDWYELSVEMAAEGIRRTKTGKKGKKYSDKDIISGNDLHDLFHHVSLPSPHLQGPS
jgi:hypothetical protein